MFTVQLSSSPVVSPRLRLWKKNAMHVRAVDDSPNNAKVTQILGLHFPAGISSQSCYPT